MLNIKTHNRKSTETETWCEIHAFGVGSEDFVHFDV